MEHCLIVARRESRPTFCANFIGNRRAHWLTRRVSQPKNNAVTAASLLFVIFLWGGNNAGTKWLVAAYPPCAFKPSPDHRV